uniref:Uncharacterized protein n=1 Tax=Rhizophora mucronata TaxID=61149 RepID=A0A2P2L7H3_RHIMU
MLFFFFPLFLSLPLSFISKNVPLTRLWLSD